MSLRESVHLVSDPENLDASVDEVFRLMLGAHCERQASAQGLQAQPEPESVTSVVGFAGVLSGACIFRCGSPTAMKVVAHMTGIEFREIDDTVKYGIGEIYNMLAGTWKGRMPDLSAHFNLSVPAVITGRDYNLRMEELEFKLSNIYRFEEACFSVAIVCDGMQ